MTDKQIGNLVKEIRKEKYMSRAALAYGLCDEATIAYFERGKRKLDNLLIQRIFDRIGIEADEFAFMVTEEEYDYFLWKEQVFQAMEKQDWDELEALLGDEKIAIQIIYNEEIQYQYYYKMKAILEAEKYQNYKMAAELLGKAMEQTMPDIFTIKWKKLCLGEQELHILMLYLYYGVKGEGFEKEEENELYRKLANYITREHMEEKKLAKLCPKLVCIWMNITALPLLERKKLCETAIQLLQETRRLHDILEVLRLYVEILEEENAETVVYYRKHYKNFKDIFSEAGIVFGFRPELLAGRREKLFLITEYLCSARMAKGMTQEEVSFDICEPETYSRIETGKHTPVKTNLYRLTERLGISWSFYRGEIEIGSLKAYRLYQMVKKCSNRGQNEKTLYWLEELELLLDMKNPVNVQYVEFEKIIAERELERIDVEEAYKRLEEVLMLTTILPVENQFRYYSQMELEILGEMGRMLYKQKKYEEGIMLLKRVIRNQRKSRVKWDYRWNGIEFVLRILADVYFGAQRYEEANDIDNYVMRRNLKQAEAIHLPHLLDCMADNYEHMGEQYSFLYMKLYRQTYYVTDFFGFEDFFQFMETYYKEKFDPNIKWY